MTNIKMLLIWTASVTILFYWMMFFLLDKTFDGIFQLSITLLIAEKALELWEYIHTNVIEEVDDPV